MDYELMLGDKLEVLIGEHRCVSDVQEITEDGHLIISAPMYRSMVVPLLEGELLHVVYYRKAGMFSFVAQLIRRYREGEADLVELALKSPISKYQRRDFVRLDTVIPLSVRLIARPQHVVARSVDEILRMIYDQRYVGVPRPLGEGEEIYSGYTIDISGGGVRFASRESFETGALVECTLHLSESNEVTVDGQIVRQDSEGNAGQEFRASIQFVNIEERIRRKIIKHIFDQQAKDHLLSIGLG